MEPKEIALTLLIVNILFHYYSYSFTIAAVDYTDYSISLPIEDLYTSGILLGEYDAQNVTWQGGFVNFQINASTMRAAWQDFTVLAGGHGVGFQQRVPFFSYSQWVDINWVDRQSWVLWNSTIVQQWDDDRNWSMFRAETGYILFITDPSGENNITKAVYETGNLTLTMAEDIAWLEEPNLLRFISWYTSLITGQQSWGLPEEFRIIVRIMSLVGVVSAVFLLSELRRIVF